MQFIFRRYEKKYLISRSQYESLLPHLLERMESDHYDRYLVQNLYYDTERFDCARTSIAKPVYREKLRLRCYGVPCDGSGLFLELKKKFEGVVYKRRINIPYKERGSVAVRDMIACEDSQISREIGYFHALHPVSEKIHIAYERYALTSSENPGLRITFDTDIRFRVHELNFTGALSGTAILPPGQILMEIKTLGAMPLWLSRPLCEAGVFPRSFSKYGIWYTQFFQAKRKGDEE
jgi:hypothetical protein